MSSRHWTGLLACAVALLAACSDEPEAVDAAQAGPPGNGVCLRVDAIDHTDVVDDFSIRFVMKNGKVWKNTLAFQCTSLKFEGGFAYETETDEICSNGQTIRVLRSGTLCELGQFTPDTAPAPKAP